MIYSIILTNNSRSLEYIDLLMKRKLFPQKVILVDNDKNLFFKKLILKKLKKKVFVKIFRYKTINNKFIKKYLMNIKEKVIVYCGYPGQIIMDKNLLKNKFFLHSHSGKIPEFKGSTTIFYSILLERKIFCTSFRLNEMIDSGEIVFKQQYNLPKNLNKIDDYDNKIRAINTFKSLNILAKGNFKHKKNKIKNNFSNYHIMHPVLRYITCK